MSFDNPLIVAKNIIMEFGSGDAKTKVIHGVDIALERGKVTMLVGPSGCGKTTLISILTGILTPTSGTVLFEKENLFALSDDNRSILRRKNIGFVFQQYNLLNTLTAAENVSIPLIADGTPFRVAQNTAKRTLQILGMEEHIDQFPQKLSGGEQQRVAIARALVHSPQLVVCDEPTASLDSKNGKKVIALLKEVTNDSNRSVLVVTHDNRILEYADSIIHLDDGKIKK